MGLFTLFVDLIFNVFFMRMILYCLKLKYIKKMFNFLLKLNFMRKIIRKSPQKIYNYHNYSIISVNISEKQIIETP